MVYGGRRERRDNFRNVTHHRRRSSLGLFDNRRARTPVTSSQFRRNDSKQERPLSSRRAASTLMTPTSNRSRARNQNSTTHLLHWSSRPRRTPQNEKDLTYMYEKVLKYVQKGQIKSRNCWDITFVKHVDDIVKMDEKNFTRNGSVINAASVVLTTQIDSVHNQGIRVWRSLGTKKSLNPSETIKRRIGRTTVSNNKLITVTKPSELLGSRDPLFEKTAGMFDEGGVKGLLLANLGTQDGEIVFRGDDCLVAFKENQALKCKIISVNKISEGSESSNTVSSEKDIFPALIQMFSDCEEKKTKLCINTNFCSNVINFYNKQKDSFATGLTDELEQNIPNLDFDRSLSDADNSFDDTINLDDMSGDCSVSSGTNLNVPDLITTENQEEFEFEMSTLTSYFSKDDVQSQSWKGPESWKRKRIQAMRKEVSSNNIPMLKALHEKRLSDNNKTPNKECTAINFLEFLLPPSIIKDTPDTEKGTDSEIITPVSETNTEIDSLHTNLHFIQSIINDKELNNIPDSERPDESSVLMKRMMLQTDQTLFEQVDRYKILMSKSKYNARRNNHHYLPRDLDIKPDYFFRCSLRPNVILWCKEPTDLPIHEDEYVFDLDENEYDSDVNPLDTKFDDNYDDISDNPIEQITNFVSPSSETPLVIPYNKDPCDINVSMMKKKIWKIICEKEDSGVARIQFKELVSILVSRLPSHVTKKLTIHIIFVCLLYCCNEYCLRIRGVDLNTFEIATTVNSPIPPKTL